MDAIEKLYQKMSRLYEERQWARFHSPKNVVMDLASEVGELIEHFRWLTEKESATLTEEQQTGVKEELGDVFIVLVHLAKKLGIDLVEAADLKLDQIAQRYPADQARGRCDKYTAYNP